MTERVFLTGATGYIGSHLLRKWLDASEREIFVLARARRDVPAKARIEAALAGLNGSGDAVGPLPERVEIVEGDLALDRLGLEPATWARLAEGTGHIVHCAAAARFDLDLDDARRINVGGTTRVLELARACPGLERLDYIGTAYVAGRRKGLIREDELDEGQAHNNTYERSKLEAETLVRANQAELPIAILRPSIVICDSRTGRVSAYNGFSRALAMYASDIMRMVPGRAGSKMDLVPVDYVVEATWTLAQLPAAAGGCYHLTAGVGGGTALGEIRDLASEHFDKRPFDILPRAVFAGLLALKKIQLPAAQRKIVEEVRLYVPYLVGELEFDNTNTTRDTGLEAPPVRDYFARMAAYMRR